ncbi:hypothetical protein KR038_007139, partial [Drosophila bunnanda]
FKWKSSEEPTTSAGGELAGGKLADGIVDGSGVKDNGEMEGDDVDLKVQRVGPGRPRILRTGRPGRPKKQFNVLGTMVAKDIQFPST